jgi:type IV pilus assembly protein PilA
MSKLLSALGSVPGPWRRPVPRPSLAHRHGFTIVEVLIVVAVIGVMAVIAIPLYEDYALRSKHAEIVTAAATCRTSVSEALQSATLPQGGDPWGCASVDVTRYVSSISVGSTGKITIATRGVRNKSDGGEGGQLTLIPLGEDGATVAQGARVARWRCGAREDGTDIRPDLLPRSCNE